MQITKSILEIYKKLDSVSDSIFKKMVDTGDRSLYLAFVLTKAHKSHKAIFLLCENGYGQDAFMLSRTLVELSIQTSYILSDKSNERLRRYIDYDWVVRKEMHDYLVTKPEHKKILAQREPTDSNFENILEEVEEKYNEVTRKYKYNRRTGWSDKTLYGMALVVNRKDEYNSIYKLQSILGHSNVRSANEYITSHDGKIVMSADPDETSITEALLAGFDFYTNILYEVSKDLSLNTEDSLDELRKKILTILQ